MKATTTAHRKNGSTRTEHQQHQDEDASTGLSPVDDLRAYVRRFVRQQPEVGLLIGISVGFILGWKSKLW